APSSQRKLWRSLPRRNISVARRASCSPSAKSNSTGVCSRPSSGSGSGCKGSSSSQLPTSVLRSAPLLRHTCTPRRFSSFWAALASAADDSTPTCSWSSKPATAAAWLTPGGTADDVRASWRVARSGNLRIMAIAVSATLLLGPALLLRRVARRRGRLLSLLLARHGDGADLLGLEDTALDELVHQRAVLLLVLGRQRVLVGLHRHDNVLFPGRRVGEHPDRQFRHTFTPYQARAFRAFFSSLGGGSASIALSV